MTAEAVHIVCFGNVWQGDDGFGIQVFRKLASLSRLPPNVRLFEAGISGLGALNYFENCTKVILVDAVQSGGGEIGRVQRLAADDLALPADELSIHNVGVNHLLAFLAARPGGEALPELVLVGAEIGPVKRFADELSEPLQRAVAVAVLLILSECAA